MSDCSLPHYVLIKSHTHIELLTYPQESVNCKTFRCSRCGMHVQKPRRCTTVTLNVHDCFGSGMNDANCQKWRISALEGYPVQLMFWDTLLIQNPPLPTKHGSKNAPPHGGNLTSHPWECGLQLLTPSGQSEQITISQEALEDSALNNTTCWTLLGGSVWVLPTPAQFSLCSGFSCMK